MPLHPILPSEVATADLHGKTCRHSLSVSRRACADFPQLLNFRAIPKEMPLLLTKVANFGPGLFARLLHLLQFLGLCIALFFQFLQLLFLGHRGDRIRLRALLNVPSFPLCPANFPPPRPPFQHWSPHRIPFPLVRDVPCNNGCNGS